MSDSDSPKQKGTKTPPHRQKPRHVPSFCPLKDQRLEQTVQSFATEEVYKNITEHYEIGTIGLRRYAVTHQDEVDGLICDFSKRSTRLTNDSTDRTVVTVGFTGRKKRWTLCPSSECIPKADKREKIVGQWKILHLPPKGDDLVVPRCVHEAYQDVVDDCSYFAATLCPQQTYCAKHSHQGGFVDKEWHYHNRHQFALHDFIVFCDHTQRVVAVWRLMDLREKYSGQAEVAESNLIKVMHRVLDSVREKATRTQQIRNHQVIYSPPGHLVCHPGIKEEDSSNASENRFLRFSGDTSPSGRVLQISGGHMGPTPHGTVVFGNGLSNLPLFTSGCQTPVKNQQMGLQIGNEYYSSCLSGASTDNPPSGGSNSNKPNRLCQSHSIPGYSPTSHHGGVDFNSMLSVHPQVHVQQSGGGSFGSSISHLPAGYSAPPSSGYVDTSPCSATALRICGSNMGANQFVPSTQFFPQDGFLLFNLGGHQGIPTLQNGSISFVAGGNLFTSTSPAHSPAE